MKYTHTDNFFFFAMVYGSLTWGDFISTYLVINRGGIELNKFMAPLIGNPLQFLIFKIVGACIIILLALGSRYFYDDGDYFVLSSACGMGIMVVVWNIVQLWTYL